MIKLIALLAAAIPALISGILAFIARKATTAASSLGMFILVTVAFISCINLIMAQIVGVLSLPPWAASAIGMFIPSNFGAVIGAIWSSKICRASYDMARFKIKLINSAN